MAIVTNASLMKRTCENPTIKYANITINMFYKHYTQVQK